MFDCRDPLVPAEENRNTLYMNVDDVLMRVHHAAESHLRIAMHSSASLLSPLPPGPSKHSLLAYFSVLIFSDLVLADCSLIFR